MSDQALAARIGDFVVQPRISPLALAKAEQEMRKRARNAPKQDPERSDW